MYSIKGLTLSITTAILLTACGSNDYPDYNYGSSQTVGQSISQEFTLDEKYFLHALMRTEYLWYDQVAETVDYTLYDTAQSMIDALKAPLDYWSFVMSSAEYDSFAYQETAGFGFGYIPDNYQVFIVMIDSPVYGKLLRGDKILKINGYDVTATEISVASSKLGTQATFTVLRDEEIIELQLTPQEYTYSVTLPKIIEYHNKNIGYLRYDSFTESSISEIESAFTIFSNAHIDELVIDLRYNHGGSIQTASTLLNNITSDFPGDRQVYLDWNDQYKKYNSDYNFENLDQQDGNELKMSRIFFLTTEDSVSASELVISALKPYLGESNVITIGTKTRGKPVGMSGRVYGDNYYFLINFLVKNNDDVASSFDGIPATCYAYDDINRVMGDPDESMLKEALYYINYNHCSDSESMSKKYVNTVQKSAHTPYTYPLKQFNGLILTPSPAHD